MSIIAKLIKTPLRKLRESPSAKSKAKEPRDESEGTNSNIRYIQDIVNRYQIPVPHGPGPACCYRFTITYDCGHDWSTTAGGTTITTTAAVQNKDKNKDNRKTENKKGSGGGGKKGKDVEVILKGAWHHPGCTGGLGDTGGGGGAALPSSSLLSSTHFVDNDAVMPGECARCRYYRATGNALS